jgi:hypothetical protein
VHIDAVLGDLGVLVHAIGLTDARVRGVAVAGWGGPGFAETGFVGFGQREARDFTITISCVWALLSGVKTAETPTASV